MRAPPRILVAWTALVTLAVPLSCRSGTPAPDAMPAMDGQTMSGLMEMDDSAPIGKVMLDQLEADGGSGTTQLAWDGQAWFGGDYDKLWIKSEGSPTPTNQDSSRNELLWDHALTRWWDLQAGVRYDLGDGPARGWAAIGVEGLAPYWFDLEATLYVGEAGRTAAHLQIEHDLLITQRLIVQPEIESDLYSKSDGARNVTSGFSELQLALRVRYEIRRELAPYVGVAWRRELGTLWVAGFHAWL